MRIFLCGFVKWAMKIIRIGAMAAKEQIKVTSHSVATDKLIICPGSGFMHGEVWIWILATKKCLWCQCGLCIVRIFLKGLGWKGKGLTKEEVLRRNPTAFIQQL